MKNRKRIESITAGFPHLYWRKITKLEGNPTYALYIDLGTTFREQVDWNVATLIRDNENNRWIGNLTLSPIERELKGNASPEEAAVWLTRIVLTNGSLVFEMLEEASIERGVKEEDDGENKWNKSLKKRKELLRRGTKKKEKSKRLDKPTKGEFFVYNGRYGRLDIFYTALFKVFTVASERELELFRKGFSEEVAAYIKYIECVGWWEKIVERVMLWREMEKGDSDNDNDT